MWIRVVNNKVGISEHRLASRSKSRALKHWGWSTSFTWAIDGWFQALRGSDWCQASKAGVLMSHSEAWFINFSEEEFEVRGWFCPLRVIRINIQADSTDSFSKSILAQPHPPPAGGLNTTVLAPKLSWQAYDEIPVGFKAYSLLSASLRRFASS